MGGVVCITGLQPLLVASTEAGLETATVATAAVVVVAGAGAEIATLVSSDFSAATPQRTKGKHHRVPRPVRFRSGIPTRTARVSPSSCRLLRSRVGANVVLALLVVTIVAAKPLTVSRLLQGTPSATPAATPAPSPGLGGVNRDSLVEVVVATSISVVAAALVYLLGRWCGMFRAPGAQAEGGLRPLRAAPMAIPAWGTERMVGPPPSRQPQTFLI
jgi:hypothetical protein